MCILTYHQGLSSALFLRARWLGRANADRVVDQRITGDSATGMQKGTGGECVGIH
jgi:hypothetical protein